jgi:hypothetical protein
LPSDVAVTQLYLDPDRTGGEQTDDVPGDDGIVVVLEPRDADNRYVPLAGRVNVVLLDPQQRARVARWDFTAAEAQAALAATDGRPGIELHMPWRDAPPPQERLHLFVRFWLADGSTLEQDQLITITPPDKLAARWTPRAARLSEPAARPINVAESPAQGRSEPAEDAATGTSSQPAGASPDGADAAAQQAQRPEWRPYR